MNIAQSSLNFWRAANSPTLILDEDQQLSVSKPLKNLHFSYKLHIVAPWVDARANYRYPAQGIAVRMMKRLRPWRGWAIYTAGRPLLQADIEEKKTSLNPVALTDELRQAVRHGGRRRVRRGPRTVAILLASLSRASIAVENASGNRRLRAQLLATTDEYTVTSILWNE